MLNLPTQLAKRAFAEHGKTLLVRQYGSICPAAAYDRLAIRVRQKEICTQQHHQTNLGRCHGRRLRLAHLALPDLQICTRASELYTACSRIAQKWM